MRLHLSNPDGSFFSAGFGLNRDELKHELRAQFRRRDAAGLGRLAYEQVKEILEELMTAQSDRFLGL